MMARHYEEIHKGVKMQDDTLVPDLEWDGIRNSDGWKEFTSSKKIHVVAPMVDSDPVIVSATSSNSLVSVEDPVSSSSHAVSPPATASATHPLVGKSFYRARDALFLNCKKKSGKKKVNAKEVEARPPSSRRVTRDIRGDRLFEGEFKVGDYCFASQGEDRYEDGEHVYLHPATIKSVTDSIVYHFLTQLVYHFLYRESMMLRMFSITVLCLH